MKIKTKVCAGVVVVLLMTMAVMLYINNPGTDPEEITAVPDVVESTPSSVANDVVAIAPVINEQSGTTEQTTENEETNTDTSISVCMEVTGFWNKENTYDWSVQKTILGVEGAMVSEDGRHGKAVVSPIDGTNIQYQLIAHRWVAHECERKGISGSVKVTNTGNYPTESLTIVDRVQTCDDCGCECVAEFTIDTSVHPVLCPGESFVYTYEFEFDGIAGAAYRNTAVVSIGNSEGSSSETGCAVFNIPANPSVVMIDQCAMMVDTFDVPAGFMVSSEGDLSWVLEDDAIVVVNVMITSTGDDCANQGCLVNSVTLTEGDSGVVAEDTASVELSYQQPTGGNDGGDDHDNDGCGDHHDDGCHHWRGGHHDGCGGHGDHHHQPAHRDGLCQGHGPGYHKAPGHCH